MKYTCKKCDSVTPCILEIEEEDCACPWSCPFDLDSGADWDVLEEWKNMKNKDSLVICDSCANNDETCTACNSCISGSNFVMMPGIWKLEEKTEKLSCSKDPKSRYYDAGGIETLDIIKAKLTPEQYRGFLLGNIIKYSCRVNHKGNFDRDIEKVRFYGNSIFDTLEV